MTSPTDSVETLRARYRELAVEWAEAQDDPPTANAILQRHHALAKEIRRSAAGREAIEGLLDDPLTPVRLAAATDSLAWSCDRGVAVLEEIESETNGLYAVDAKWTLRSYHSGKLDLDW